MNSLVLDSPVRAADGTAPIDTTLAPGSRRKDVGAVAVWILSAAIVLYLGLNAGGYDLAVRNQVGLVAWWAILILAVIGVLPTRRTTVQARVALALFAGFAAWMAIATTSSHSYERSLDELSRVACYLGLLLLATAIHRQRDRAVRLTVGALGAAFAIIAGLALLSRLRPGTFAAAAQTGSLLPGDSGRLAWPIDYWNGLAALMALALPLLLASATAARRLFVQAVAAAAIPLVSLCAYLTFSRGGMLAIAGGLAVFVVLAEDRIPKLLTGAVAGGASAILILAAGHRSAIENGLVNELARHQGRQLSVAVVLVCAGTALAQVGIGLAVRHGVRPKWLRIPKTRARALLLVGLLTAVLAGVADSAPSRLSHAWQTFKKPTAAALNQNAVGRFGSASGNGRYAYWKVALKATAQHPITGWGPGTFQYVWLSRAPFSSYVENAHSLYFETLVEDGIPGLALLLGFIGFVLAAAVRATVRVGGEQRVLGAAVTAACVAFAISAGFDWVWQIPVLPVSFLLLAAAILAPERGASAGDEPSKPRSRQLARLRYVAGRAGLVAGATACLIVIVIPLTTTNDLRKSERAAARGDLNSALTYARAAVKMEPNAASPQVQSALVLELRGNLPVALSAARRATADEPLNWSAWLIRFRLEAESGHPRAALASFRRARSLNRFSPIFQRLS